MVCDPDRNLLEFIPYDPVDLERHRHARQPR
jgi:hypothetical protein